LNTTDARILLTQPLPKGLSIGCADRVVQLEKWCRLSTDHYLALTIAADVLVSIDSLAIHAASAAKIPGIVIFTTLHPDLRLTYAPHLTGLMLPGAATLKTWGKHKTDDNWPEEQVTYNQAWEAMDRTSILDAVKSVLVSGAPVNARECHGNSKLGSSPAVALPTFDNQAAPSELQGFSMALQKKVLHVGCGHPDPNKLHTCFRTPEWTEVRLDIDPSALPDVVADIRDLSQLPDAKVDAIWSSHNLEHLYSHDVPLALKEFRRVIRPDGFALITLPDLQEVARLIADGQLDDPAYVSPAGPIAPLDILYGHRSAMAQGNLFMAHRTGFTAKTLAQALLSAGFAMVSVQRNPSAFSLWAIAFSTAPSDDQLKAAQGRMFPLVVQ
jgi:SAM-dependent methyltransferase